MIDFRGVHYPRSVILHAVFFYMRYAVSYRDLQQGHCFIKRITRPMMGFNAFHSAAATIAGIEAAHKIRKGQIPAKGASAFQTFAELAG